MVNDAMDVVKTIIKLSLPAHHLISTVHKESLYVPFYYLVHYFKCMGNGGI